jgi:hypothetical protein
MHLKTLALAAVVTASFVFPVSAGAQSGTPSATDRPTELSPALQASIRDALQHIAASPVDNELLLAAVRANYESRIRELLVEHGVDAAVLSAAAIDAAGPAAGPRKHQAGTLYFAAGENPAAPQGLVNMGPPYGWVDWNTFDPWAYFFD